MVPPEPSRAWIAFLALALAITAFQLATMAPEIGWNGDDYTAYIRNASALVHGTPYAMQGYVINPNMDIGIGAYPPVYPLLLAGPVAVFGENYAALDAWTIMLYGGAVFALMLYARPLTGTLGALLAGAAAGLGPFVYDWKNAVMSEFCFVLMLFLALLGERRLARGGDGVATGLAMAAAVLTRAVGGALWPAVLAADWLRTRRLRRPVVLCVLGSVALVAAVMLGMRNDAFLQYTHLFRVNTELQLQAGGAAPGMAPMGLQHGALAVSVGDRLGVIADNLREAPGNLSVLWGFGAQFDPALKSGAVGVLGKVLTGLLLLAGAAGVVLRLVRGASAAETFFVIELAGLMLMPRTLITTRLFLPLSVMLAMYVFVTARAVQLRLGWRLPLAQGVAGLLLLSSCAIGYAGLLPAQRDGFTADKPPAVAFFDWVKAHTDGQALFVSRSPRALIFYTGRRAVDYHLDHVDAGFLAWAQGLRADELVLNIDLIEVKALARAQGLPMTTVGLNRALDLYEAQFFGAYRDRFPVAYANEWFRVYRIVP